MTKVIEYPLNDKSVLVQVTTQTDFVNCTEDLPSPFKHGKSILSQEIKIDEFEKVVIKCLIDESERSKIVKNNGESGQSICHNVVEKFIKDNWTNADLKQIETINCNHFEQQYKYIIIKK